MRYLISVQLTGRCIGFMFSYFLFSAIIFLILTISEKIPDSWSYLHILLLTGVVVSLGIILRRVLR